MTGPSITLPVASTEATLAALRSVAAFVRNHRTEIAGRHRSAIQRRLLSAGDPLTTSWDIFAAFGVAWGETWYTQFFAAMLGGRCGNPSRTVAWMALCELVAGKLDQSTETQPTAHRWRLAAAATATDVAVHDECSGVVDYQVFDNEPQRAQTVRPDITIDAPGLHVILEIKLGGTWNGPPGVPVQAIAYEALGKQRVPATSLLSLVSLATRALPDAAGFLNLTWGQYAIELRRQLHRLEPNSSTLLELAPVVAFLIALERDQLGLRLPSGWDTAPLGSLSMNEIHAMGSIAQHLGGV